MPSPKSRSRAIEILDRRIARLEAERDRLATRPEDRYATGSVLRFTKRFNKHGQTYHYAVIKASTGKWYATGSQMPMSWDELLDLIESEGGTVDGVSVVTRTQIVGSLST